MLRLVHNITSDMDDEEYEALIIGDSPVEARSLQDEEWIDDPEPRELQSVPMEFDHQKLGYMTPVRNMGSCGASWAFTATTTYEGYLGKKAGKRFIGLSSQ